MLSVRKNSKIFIIRCDRQIMAVYIKKVLSVRCQVLGKITNFLLDPIQQPACHSCESRNPFWAMPHFQELWIPVFTGFGVSSVERNNKKFDHRKLGNTETFIPGCEQTGHDGLQ
ncbi:Uncharacterized protein dnm_066460 [Desulfonema magnum]|uniref:Uncharacterized protein n=1 Tax=Desulfonema magnum TaxID=45655 RepID=A0A975BRZ2_9BACT|nr:Uncharacterized protein dnm_066460 [Desulfonema magnum]